MTDRLEIIGRLRTLGIAISLDGPDLLVRPAKRVPAELLERIRESKPDLVRILSGPKTACPHCGGSVVHDETFDHFTNRLCVSCGRWLRCLSPGCDPRDAQPVTTSATSAVPSPPLAGRPNPVAADVAQGTLFAGENA